LAFHRYPQLIRAFCNRRRFGPPRALTRASAWPWVDHLVSGLPHATVLLRASPFQTRFPSGSGCHSLTLATHGNSPVHSTKGTPSACPKATASDSVSAHGFRICFTPLDGVLFTFPSRYCALSVVCGIQPWRVVPPASHGISRVPRYSRFPERAKIVSPTGLSPTPVAPSSSVRLRHWFVTRPDLLPGSVLVRPTPVAQRRQPVTRNRFRLLPFRSPLLREYSLFLRVLRCFSSPTYLSTAYRFSWE
jgi:hypothetical protein